MRIFQPPMNADERRLRRCLHFMGVDRRSSAASNVLPRRLRHVAVETNVKLFLRVRTQNARWRMRYGNSD